MPARMGGYGPGSFTPDIALNILKSALGLPIHLVTGYKGTAEIRLAVESGELAGSAFSWDSMKVTWRKAIDAGDIVIILQLVPKPFSDLPNVPLALNLASTAEERRLIEVGIHSNGIFARPFVLPPGTPAERVQMLRKAFQETLEDKEFLAEADKSKLGLDPVTGEELERSVLDLFKVDRALLNKLRDIISK